MSRSIFVVFLFLALCEESNILHHKNVKKYEFMNSTCFSSLGYAYENQKGDNCAIRNPYIYIEFASDALAYISKIQVQREGNGLTSGNVRQIEAIFLNGSNMTINNEITGQPLTWQSPKDDPTITGYFPEIRGVILKVLQTDNNESVRRFRLRIFGCYSAGKKIFIFSISTVRFFFSSPRSLSTNIYRSTNYTKFM